jgi:hypothetical protein
LFGKSHLNALSNMPRTKPYARTHTNAPTHTIRLINSDKSGLRSVSFSRQVRLHGKGSLDAYGSDSARRQELNYWSPRSPHSIVCAHNTRGHVATKHRTLEQAQRHLQSSLLLVKSTRTRVRDTHFLRDIDHQPHCRCTQPAGTLKCSHCLLVRRAHAYSFKGTPWHTRGC